jgi:hypothetical protein
MTTPNPPPTTLCPECRGAGIEFRGQGLDMQYKICSAYKASDAPNDHPTMADVKARIRQVITAVRPSGRYA